MVADAIVRYRLDDDSKNSELVEAIKDSAALLHGGDYNFLSYRMHMLRLTTFPTAVETVCFLVFSCTGI